MGRASRTKVEVSRREKVAAQREAARRAERRRRILLASGSIVVVLVIVLVFVVVKLNSKPAKSGPNGPTGAALTALIDKVTTVPASTLDAVGAGSGLLTLPQSTKGSPAALTLNGKPEVLFMGAEYCPYCAAERWSMIVALSRFGTFSGLATVHSSSTDVFANTPTFTFAKASYTSKYLSFVSVELCTNVPSGLATCNGYKVLQTPTAAQQALETKYDAPPYVTAQYAGSIPFIDFGNQTLIIGATYDPTNFASLGWNTIAADLSNPNSSVAKEVDGTANYITAAVCKQTGNQPASACTPTVKALESRF
jgi:hypothetical protein